MADRINSAKEQTTGKTNLDQVPTQINPNPGDTNIQVDTTQIDTAGQQVNQQQLDANAATAPDKVKTQTQSAKNIEYNKPLDSTYPTEPDPGKQVPKPNNKGFMERLLDAQIASKLTDNTSRPAGNTQADYPKDQGNDINKPTTQANTPTRPNITGFDPANIMAIEPQQPSWEGQGNIPRATPGGVPGPKYSPPVQASMPKINMPKFKGR